MKKMIIIALLLSCVCGCRPMHGKMSALVAADTMALVRPDSAWAMIRCIDPSTITDAANRAYYAITYSRILDRNGIDVDNDSLIRIAADYYEENGSQHERALTYYYLGRICGNAGNVRAAVEAFVKAKNTFGTDTLDRTYFLTCSMLGGIYADQYMFDRSVTMFKTALRGFEQLGEKYNQMAVGIGLGRTLRLQYKYDEGLEYNNQSLKIAEELGDTATILVVTAHSINVRLIVDSDADKSIKLLFAASRKYGRTRPPLADYPMLAYAYNLKKMPDSARHYCNEYINRYSEASASQMLGAYMLLAKTEEHAGNLQKLVAIKDSILHFKDVVNNLRVETSIIDVEQRYINMKLHNDLVASNQRNSYLLIIGALILAVIMIVMSMIVMARRRIIKRKNKEIEEYVSAISGFERSQDNLLSSLDMQVSKERELKELLENRFAQCKELATAYYLHGKSKSLANKIMELTINDELLRDLEAMTDLYNEGVVTKLREEMPALQESDVNIFVLVTAGFSSQEISAVTGYSLNNVYVRKTRLKQKLDEADINFKEQILSVFARKDTV